MNTTTLVLREEFVVDDEVTLRWVKKLGLPETPLYVVGVIGSKVLVSTELRGKPVFDKKGEAHFPKRMFVRV